MLCTTLLHDVFLRRVMLHEMLLCEALLPLLLTAGQTRLGLEEPGEPMRSQERPSRGKKDKRGPRKPLDALEAPWKCQ